METEPDTCQYRGYRNGPEHEDPYELSTQYYIIFGARLLFVVIFEVSDKQLHILIGCEFRLIHYSLF